MDKLTALFAGLLFGAGVTLSGMVNPMKVQNFMDLFGTWDPTLLFVMGAALATAVAGYAFVLRWRKPLYAESFSSPAHQLFDYRLMGGAALFGLGWGLSGFCPGPALASLVFGYWPSVLFVLAMAAGMLIVRLTSGRSAS
ncbi:DUF6691 family protein [Aestuariivirga sp.]|uniref:DUF6691 family protein n=1 Tax=Aestuariivirga sp. TaxID=2650926 RepID=UPI003BABE129